MLLHLAAFYENLDFSEWWAVLASWFTLILAIMIVSYISNYIAKHYLITFFDHWVEKRGSRLGHAIIKHRVFLRLSHIIPALIIYLAVPWIMVDNRPITETVGHFIQMATKIYIVVIMTVVLCSFSNLVEEYYRQFPIAKQRPIKSYLEVLKIIVVVLAVILIGSIVMHKSPVVLLTGLGAATAVLSLVFKDSLLGFMASIQMASYDLVRIGDWIEVPSYGADGEVIDISLNTVKVQNWDKTIVIIPTYALTNTQMKNWRGMLDAGGRRVKRAINIDMHSIRFCNEEILAKMRQIPLINEYLEKYHTTFEMTNISLFRTYAEYFLRNHPDIHQEMLYFVRQLAPSPEGLPIEIYAFIHRTNIYEYENSQADLFDHLLAMLPYFGLRVFQNPTD